MTFCAKFTHQGRVGCDKKIDPVQVAFANVRSLSDDCSVWGSRDLLSPAGVPQKLWI